MIVLLSTFFINASPTPDAPGLTEVPGATGTTGPAKAFSLKDGKTITLTAIHFSGNKAIPTSQLEYLAKPFLNRTLSESGLSELKRRIILLYQSKGYNDAEVNISGEQKGSILTVEIEEGKLVSDRTSSS
jgi:hemolysin activation/secretion protein